MDRKTLIAAAEAQVAAYPQYAGHFDNYVLVRIQGPVKSRLGLAFAAGELAIARPDAHVSTSAAHGTRRFYTVFSARNGIDTSVPARKVALLG